MHRRIAHAASLHLCWPAHDERDANAAFIRRAFAFAERGVVRDAGKAAVVAGEDDEGVVAELEFIKFRQQAAHFVVEMLQHGEVVRDGALAAAAFIVCRPFEATSDMFLDQRLRRFQLRVRAEMRHKGKPRLTAIRFDEADDVVRDGGDGFILVMLVAIRRTGEVEAVGVKVTFTLPQGCDGVVVCDMPLAADTGRVARFAQVGCQCGCFWSHRIFRLGGTHGCKRGFLLIQHLEHARASAVLPGEKGGTRRRALRIGIRLREQHPLRRETIQVRRLQVFVAVTTQRSPSHVIGEDVEDIRLAHRSLGGVGLHRK
jgi:hypothetical protein